MSDLGHFFFARCVTRANDAGEIGKVSPLRRGQGKGREPARFAQRVDKKVLQLAGLLGAVWLHNHQFITPMFG